MVQPSVHQAVASPEDSAQDLPSWDHCDEEAVR